jgi:hypothetical protein
VELNRTLPKMQVTSHLIPVARMVSGTSKQRLGDIHAARICATVHSENGFRLYEASCYVHTYVVVSKIFWTDAIKVMKLTIKPITCHHP